MRIADRYIGWQVLYGTIFGVTLLTAILVLGQIFREIRPLLVEQRAPLWLVGQFMLLILPFSLMFTLPWGFLASTLLSFGRLSSHNELLGWRMAGLSLFRVALPVLVIGGLLSWSCSWLTGSAAPNAKHASRSLLYEAVKRDPRALLDPGIVQNRLKEQKVYVEDRDESGVLKGFHLVQLSDETRDARPIVYVYSDTVDLVVDPDEQLLRLKLTDAYIETIRENGSIELAFSGEAEPWIIDFSGTGKAKTVKPSDVKNSDIPKAIAASHEIAQDLERQLGDDTLAEDARIAIEGQINYQSVRRKELGLELHKRRSISLACFSFALIGIPLGITARRRETSSGLLISILVAAGYFGLVIIAGQISDAPYPVVVSMLWAPNILCILLGTWLFRRAGKR